MSVGGFGCGYLQPEGHLNAGAMIFQNTNWTLSWLLPKVIEIGRKHRCSGSDKIKGEQVSLHSVELGNRRTARIFGSKHWRAKKSIGSCWNGNRLTYQVAPINTHEGM